MFQRVYKTDPAILKTQALTLIEDTNDSRFQHKVEMVSLVLSGMSAEKLGEYSGDSKNAINGWVRIADEQGIDALRDNRKGNSGRHPRLSIEQVEEIKELYLSDPSNWSGLKLSKYVQTTYKVPFSKRAAQVMMASFREENEK